jgi:hypothetical protein
MRALFWLVSFYVNPLYKYRNWNYYVLYVKLLLGNASLFNCILNVSLHYIVLKTVATVHTRLRQNVWSEHILVHDDSLNALRFNIIQSTHFSCIADLPICPLETDWRNGFHQCIGCHSYNRRLGNTCFVVHLTFHMNNFDLFLIQVLILVYLQFRLYIILHLSLVWENPTLTLNVNLLICAIV